MKAAPRYPAHTDAHMKHTHPLDCCFLALHLVGLLPEGGDAFSQSFFYYKIQV